MTTDAGGRGTPKRWTRVEVTRYGLVTVALAVGVWEFDKIAAIAAAVVAYMSAPYVAHPRHALLYLRRRKALQRYGASLAQTEYGDSLDLGPRQDQMLRAIAGEMQPFRVFISSTFSDLSAERDLLAKDVFPKIAMECEKRGVVWAPIDLRWGITEMQQQAGDVIRVCLDSVERSRPNTIGIVGSRYGSRIPFGDRDRDLLPAWVTETDGLSVTHLELRYARHAEPSDVSVFVMDHQPESSSDGLSLAAMVDELKSGGARIVSPVPDSESLSDLVHEDLLRRLDRQVPETNLDNQLLREISAHASHERRLAERPLLNAAVLSEVASHIADEATAVLRGPSGSGRSSLLAAWARKWRTEHPDDVVITRFVGLTENSQTWPQVLRSLIAEISLRTGQPMRLPTRDEEIAVGAAERVFELQTSKRIVIGLDGTDHFRARNDIESFNATNLGWLPQKGPATRLHFIPTLVTTGMEDDVAYAPTVATIDIPSLSREDRLALVTDSLARVDRRLPPEAFSAILDHPATGDPAFLGLLLDDLHSTASHLEVNSRLRTLLAARSVDELVEHLIDRVELDLGFERFPDLQAFLTLVAASPIGYTEVEIVGVLSLWRPDFDQTDLAVLRWRLSSVLTDVDGTLGVRGRYRASLAERGVGADLDEAIRGARRAYFGDRERRLTPRAIRELTLMSDADASRVLQEIVTTPHGLSALRSAEGWGYQFGLSAVVRHTGCLMKDLLEAAASGVASSTPETALAVARTCSDYGEYVMAVGVLDVVGSPANVDTRREVWALRGKLALLGHCAFTDQQWDSLFDLASQGEPAEVCVALTGMGAVLIKRGDFFWAKKYFDRAHKLAAATGDLGSLGRAGVNASVASLEGVSDPLRTPLAPTLHALFETAAASGLSTGDMSLAMEGLFRRSVLDLFAGRPESARGGFEAVNTLASELGHARFSRLARIGLRALVGTSSLQEATQCGERGPDSIGDLQSVLEREALTMLI